MSTATFERDVEILREFDPALDRVTNDRILVLRDTEAETTASGNVVLPGKRNEELKTCFGKVMAVGPKLGVPSGLPEGGNLYVPHSVQVGDKVGFQSNAGYELCIGTVIYTVMREDEVLLVRSQA